MLENHPPFIRKTYFATALLALLGSAWYGWSTGLAAAGAFALGALCSLANLWLFDRLSQAISPGAASRKPWQAGAYITRFILLLAVGYVIVKGLGVSPLPAVLGLFTSTVAVVVLLLLELLSYLFGRFVSH